MSKPKLLLHLCCGPCGTAVIERLAQDYEVTPYWFNPNIQPEEEYALRLEAAMKLAAELQMALPVDDGGKEDFLELAQGLEELPEGGERCLRCYELRLRRAKSGDREAFVRLMDHYDRRLRALAYRLLDDRDDAVDAMQDVYVKAFGALPGFREKSSVGTWLHRITYTTCCERLRQRKRTPLPLDDEEPPASSSLQARDPADEATLHADLAVALRSLSPEARAAVLLVDRDGYDYRTAAGVLGIPQGTLASRLSTAHAVLRRALRGEEASS
jgi:RNA polymerase sigma-70 factor (ECF subfamily)